jgi:hypothetical protein
MEDPYPFLRGGNKYMTVEVAQSSGSKPATTGAVANILRWLVEICATAKYFFRARRFASAERAESAALEPGAVATAPIPAHAEVELDVRTNRVAHTELDQQEIERRRNLVRTLFNDFWNGAYEKPAAFVERLDQAEDYLNERLAGSGEFWRLDANTRVMLGLPPRSNLPDNGKHHAARG